MMFENADRNSSEKRTTPAEILNRDRVVLEGSCIVAPKLSEVKLYKQELRLWRCLPACTCAMRGGVGSGNRADDVEVLEEKDSS